jgi:membrane associated rhomboid family serine protease
VRGGRYTALMFPVSDVIPSRRTPVITIGLILVNALALVYGPDLRLTTPVEPAATAPAGWMAALTSVFVHIGWLPAVASMLCLWIFGDNVEGAMGRLPFLLFYVAAGTLGAFAHVAASVDAAAPISAASAPVAAVMAAYFVLYPRSQVLMAVFLLLSMDVIEVPAVFLLGFWVLLHAVSTAAAVGAGMTTNAAFVPPVAGFAIGALIGLVLRRRVRWE